MTEKIKYICQVGPDDTYPGGIVAVIKGFLESNYLKQTPQKRIVTVSKNKKLSSFIGGIKELYKFSFERKIRVLHIHMSERGSCLRAMIIIQLFSIFNFPIIVHSHGSEIESYYAGLGSLLRSLFNYEMNKADSVIVLTNGWVSFWEQIVSRHKIQVIPNFVKKTSEKDRNYKVGGTLNLLFLGYVGDRKGTFDLIRAVKKLSQNETPVHLVIAGNGEIEKARLLIKKLDIGSSVELFGWANTDQKHRLLTKADVLVLPSHFESFGIVLLEAMMLKVPVICSNGGYSSEIVRDGIDGLICSAGSVSDIAKKISQINNASELKKFGINGRKHALSQYSEPVVILKLSSLYNTLAGEYDG